MTRRSRSFFIIWSGDDSSGAGLGTPRKAELGGPSAADHGREQGGQGDRTTDEPVPQIMKKKKNGPRDARKFRSRGGSLHRSRRRTAPRRKSWPRLSHRVRRNSFFCRCPRANRSRNESPKLKKSFPKSACNSAQRSRLRQVQARLHTVLSWDKLTLFQVRWPGCLASLCKAHRSLHRLQSRGRSWSGWERRMASLALRECEPGRQAQAVAGGGPVSKDTHLFFLHCATVSSF